MIQVSRGVVGKYQGRIMGGDSFKITLLKDPLCLTLQHQMVRYDALRAM